MFLFIVIISTISNYKNTKNIGRRIKNASKSCVFRTILVNSQTEQKHKTINMELQGKVIAILPERSGVSARGEWKSQSFVIETHDQYPRKLVFDVFGADRLAQFAINSGDEISVSFDIDAHEFNGRWFNNIRAWAVNHVDPAAVGAASAPQAASASPAGGAQAPFPPTQPAAEGSADDLPF